MLQLDPWIPMRHKDGRKCWAMLVQDYSQEHDSLFLVGFQESRELWWVPNSDLRLDDNISLGRRPAPAEKVISDE